VPSPHAQLARSASVNGPNLVDGTSSHQRNTESSNDSITNSSLAQNDKKKFAHFSTSHSEGIEKTEQEDNLESTSVEMTSPDLQHKSMKNASMIVATEIGTVRSIQKIVQEAKKDTRNRQLAISHDRSSELNSKCYSFGTTKSGNKVLLYAPALIHIFSL
jgi:hypothetical protein